MKIYNQQFRFHFRHYLSVSQSNSSNQIDDILWWPTICHHIDAALSHNYLSSIKSFYRSHWRIKWHLFYKIRCHGYDVRFTLAPHPKSSWSLCSYIHKRTGSTKSVSWSLINGFSTPATSSFSKQVLRRKGVWWDQSVVPSMRKLLGRR